MKVLLTGFGKMNKLIKSILQEDKNSNSFVIVDPDKGTTLKSLTNEDINSIDVAIDFSIPSTIIENIEFYTKHKIPSIIGTTGWIEKLGYVNDIVKENGTKLIWSSNFSLGVNLFFRLSKELGTIFKDRTEYGVKGIEFHHSQKIDNPSGTALTIRDMYFQGSGKMIEFDGIRVGSIPGTHSIILDSEEDTIEIKHTARNRNGFAKGAVFAANYIFENNFVGVKEFSKIL